MPAPGAVGALDRWAATRPADLALVDVGVAPRTATWAQLQALAETDQDRLGIRCRGARLLLHMPNGLSTVTLVLAALRLGATCIPVPPSAGARDVARFAALCAADAVVDAHGTVQWLTDPSPARPAGPQPAHIQLTSGTTGRSRGVAHHEATLDLAVSLAAGRLGVTDLDVVHVVAPMAHHTGFLYGFWLAMRAGCPQVHHRSWDARSTLDAAAAWGSTVLQATPTHLVDLVAAARDGGADGLRLRSVVVTGAPVPRDLVGVAEDALRCQVLTAWGSSELCMATLVASGDPPPVRRTDGRPLPGVELRVVDDAGDGVPPGTVGRLLARTPTMAEGFYGDSGGLPVDEDGWYATGDRATLEGDGALRIIGRQADVVNRGGVKVPVAEVEDALRSHPTVAEVAVVGRRDDRLGEQAVACVVPWAGARPQLAELTAHLRASGTDPHSWPEALVLLSVLPHNAGGKIDRPAVRAVIEAGYRTGADA